MTCLPRLAFAEGIDGDGGQLTIRATSCCSTFMETP